MSRKPCCDGEGLKKGAWTAEEDKKLIAYIQEHGEGCWHLLPQRAGLKRCGKSCRLRWNNYLKPDIKRGDFTDEEDQTIIKLHASCGNKWSVIARQLPGRTDNEIKNYWNTYLKKRLIKKGIDPVTHKPLASSDDSKNGSNPSDKETSRSSSSRSRPASLLNRMASKLSSAASSDALSQLFEGGSIQTIGRKDELGSVESFSRSSSTSRLLNKMATQVTSIKGLLSASVESCSTPCSTTSPPEPIDNFLMGIDPNAISPSYDFEYYMDNYYEGVNSSESTYSVPMEIDDLDFKISEVLDTCGNEMYINSSSYDIQDTLSTSFDKDAFGMENWSEFLIEQQSEDVDMSCTRWEEYYKNQEWSHI